MERFTTTEAAAKLGVDERRLTTLVEQHRNRLPDFKTDDPKGLSQAALDSLRRILMEETSGPRKASSDTRRGATVFAVTSGKGGVGKTSICVNLATEFAGRGLRTILVDVDLGLANAHILAGRTPGKTLSDYIDGSATLMEVVVDGPKGVKIISGGSGVKEMADLDDRGRNKVLEAIAQLKPHCDVILLDTGAGISSNVIDFVAVADHTLIVTTSNFAAIADAYGIIKVLVQSGYTHALHMIINRVRSPEEAEQVFKKLQGCTQRFLGSELNWLGLLPEDHTVEGAVLQRMPFCEAFPTSVATRYLKKLGTALERYLSVVPTHVG